MDFSFLLDSIHRLYTLYVLLCLYIQHLRSLPQFLVFTCFCYSSKIEVAYQEAIALKRQEELIREEEAAWLAEIEHKARRGSVDKEKKSKKKQVCQIHFIIFIYLVTYQLSC